MTDDDTSPLDEDTEVTPDESGVQHDNTPEVDWREKYNNLQPDYTRKSQELSQLSQEHQQMLAVLQSDDPQALNALLTQHGWGAGSEDTEDDDEFVLHDPRVDELLAEREAAQQQQMVQEFENGLRSEIDALAEEAKLKLTDKQKAVIFNHAVLSGPSDGSGRPNVKQAFEDLTGIRDEWIADYRSSKRAPSPPPVGQSGVPERPLGSRRERAAAALEIANEAFSQQQG